MSNESSLIISDSLFNNEQANTNLLTSFNQSWELLSTQRQLELIPWRNLYMRCYDACVEWINELKRLHENTKINEQVIVPFVKEIKIKTKEQVLEPFVEESKIINNLIYFSEAAIFEKLIDVNATGYWYQAYGYPKNGSLIKGSLIVIEHGILTLKLLHKYD